MILTRCWKDSFGVLDGPSGPDGMIGSSEEAGRLGRSTRVACFAFAFCVLPLRAGRGPREPLIYHIVYLRVCDRGKN